MLTLGASLALMTFPLALSVCLARWILSRILAATAGRLDQGSE